MGVSISVLLQVGKRDRRSGSVENPVHIGNTSTKKELVECERERGSLGKEAAGVVPVCVVG